MIFLYSLVELCTVYASVTMFGSLQVYDYDLLVVSWIVICVFMIDQMAIILVSLCIAISLFSTVCHHGIV